MNKTINIIKKIKKDTNNSNEITYRIKQVCNTNIHIIYNEPLTSSDTISNFIIRSLDKINRLYINKNNLDKIIFNEIDNIKITKIYTYKDICYYLNYGLKDIAPILP